MLNRSLLTIAGTARVEIVGPGSSHGASLLEYDELPDGGSAEEVNGHAYPWEVVSDRVYDFPGHKQGDHVVPDTPAPIITTVARVKSWFPTW